MSTALIAFLAFGAGLIVATAILLMKPSSATKLIPTDEVFEMVILTAPKTLPESVMAKRKEELKKLHLFYTKDGSTYYERDEVRSFIEWCLEENEKALEDVATELEDIAAKLP